MDGWPVPFVLSVFVVSPPVSFGFLVLQPAPVRDTAKTIATLSINFQFNCFIATSEKSFLVPVI